MEVMYKGWKDQTSSCVRQEGDMKEGGAFEINIYTYKICFVHLFPQCKLPTA